MTGELASSFGPYQIITRLGRGAMGVVYRAVDSRTGRDVALKVMVSDVGDDVSATRFTREGEAVSRMVHRNIVTVYEAGVMEQCPYIAMERLEGITLAQRMASDEPLSLDAKLDIVAQLCEGLQYAHDHGVVHRDVKPANVWLLKNGGVKLLDFGLAKVAGSTVTRAGCVVGSVAYMSPEQLSGVDVDGRADLFAAGVILYELLTGQRPFEAETMPGIMHRILHVTPTPVRNFVPSIAPELEEALNKALEKSPDARLPTVGDFAAELRLARYYQPAGASADSDEELDRTVLLRPAPSTTSAVQAPAPASTLPPTSITLGDAGADATIMASTLHAGSSASELRIPDPGSRIPADQISNPESLISDRGSRIPSPELLISDPGSRSPNPELLISDPGSRSPNPELYLNPLDATMLRGVEPEVRSRTGELASSALPLASVVPVASVAATAPAAPVTTLAPIAPVAPVTRAATVAPAVPRRAPAAAQGTSLVRFWPVAAAIVIAAAGYGSWRLFTTPSDVPVTEWSAASGEPSSATPGNVATPDQPPVVASKANPSSQPPVANAPAATAPVGAPAPAPAPASTSTPASAPTSPPAFSPDPAARVDAPRPEAPSREIVAPVAAPGAAEAPRPAKVEPGGVANVDVRVVGGYDFEVSGCGVTSGRATVHELQVRAPCTLRLIAPAYRLDVPRSIEATSGKVELTAPQRARVKLRTKYEWCQVVLGKHAVGTSPIELDLVAGSYTATIQCPEKAYVTRTFSIEPGQSTVKLDDYIP